MLSECGATKGSLGQYFGFFLGGVWKTQEYQGYA